MYNKCICISIKSFGYCRYSNEEKICKIYFDQTFINLFDVKCIKHGVASGGLREWGSNVSAIIISS